MRSREIAINIQDVSLGIAPRVAHYRRAPTFKGHARYDDQRVTVWHSPADCAADGGDWCEAIALRDGTIAFTVGDVSGHGDMVAECGRMVRNSILNALQGTGDPSAVLAEANTLVLDHLDGKLVTAIIAVVDQNDRTLKYANAGHPPPLLLTRQRTRYLRPSVGDLPLGVCPRQEFTKHIVVIPDDFLLVFYTDGITEHDHDVVRGEIELAKVARSVYNDSKSDVAEAIARGVLGGNRGSDDAATMVLRARKRR